MTDQPRSTGGDPTGTSSTEPAVGLITDGTYTLVVGRFPTMADAEDAYATLTQIERDTSLRIDGVVVASADADGKVHLGKVTEHSTRSGLRWGIIGGVAVGVLFPPSLLAGAVGGGAVGAAIGKVRNLSHRSQLADELEGMMTPNSAGIVALVEDTAVVEVRAALAKADAIVTKAIDKQLTAEIDREARRAKEAVTSA